MLKRGLLVLSALFALTVEAGLPAQEGILIDGAKIDQGDRTTRLVNYMGAPSSRSVAPTRCTPEDLNLSCIQETWIYYTALRIWIVSIEEGLITRIEWSR